MYFIPIISKITPTRLKHCGLPMPVDISDSIYDNNRLLTRVNHILDTVIMPLDLYIKLLPYKFPYKLLWTIMDTL